MEDLLRKLKCQSPPDELRLKTLSAARAELTRSNETDWVDRLWRSRVYWRSMAAAVLVCLVAIFAAPNGASVRQSYATAPAPAAEALARELAHNLGDGPDLERRLLAQLSGTMPSADTCRLFPAKLLRSLQ